MKIRKNLLTMAMLLASTCAGAAVAGEQAPSNSADADARFAKLDTNGDGALDKTEASKAPPLAKHFDEWDKNKDGKLTKDELPPPPGKRS